MTKSNELLVAKKRKTTPSAPFWELNLNPITMLPAQSDRFIEKEEGVPLFTKSLNNLRLVNR